MATERGWLRWPLALVFVGHGFIHALGVMVLLQLGEPGALSYADARPTPGSGLAVIFALLWAAAGAGYIVAGVLVMRDQRWTSVAIGASLVSLPAVLAMIGSAPAGALLTVGLLLFSVSSHRASKGATGSP